MTCLAWWANRTAEDCLQLRIFLDGEVHQTPTRLHYDNGYQWLCDPVGPPPYPDLLAVDEEDCLCLVLPDRRLPLSVGQWEALIETLAPHHTGAVYYAREEVDLSILPWAAYLHGCRVTGSGYRMGLLSLDRCQVVDSLRVDVLALRETEYPPLEGVETVEVEGWTVHLQDDRHPRYLPWPDRLPEGGWSAVLYLTLPERWTVSDRHRAHWGSHPDPREDPSQAPLEWALLHERPLPDLPRPELMRALARPYGYLLAQERPELADYLPRGRLEWWAQTFQIWRGREREMRELLEAYPHRDAAWIWIYQQRILADERGESQESVEARLREDPLPVVRSVLRGGGASWRQYYEVYTSGAIRTEGPLGRAIESTHEELYARCLSRGMYREMRRLNTGPLSQPGQVLITHRTTGRCLRHALRRDLAEYDPGVVGGLPPTLQTELEETAQDLDATLEPTIIPRPTTPWTEELVELPEVCLHQRSSDWGWWPTSWSLDPATILGLGHQEWIGDTLVLYADHQRPEHPLRISRGRVFTVHGYRVCSYHLLTAQAQHLLAVARPSRAKSARSVR